MVDFLEFVLKIMRWFKYRGYKRKISSIIKGKDIQDYLLDPREEGYITGIKHKGLKGFNRKPFESLGFEIDDEKINFRCAVKFHYLYWMVKQIYGCRKVFKDMLFYKEFVLCSSEEFVRWIGGDRFADTVYILYKIRDNLNKGMLLKPAGILWEDWERILDSIRLYINFYVGGNYALCLNLMNKGKDKYSVMKEDIIKGYEALKLYWEVFN